MKKLLVIILLGASLGCSASGGKKSDNIDLKKVESFLARLYAELKCPSYPMQNNYKLEVCISSLTYDLDDGRILFAFTAYPENNRLLQDFYSLSKSGRKAKLLNLTQVMAKFTGILPVEKGDRSIFC